MGCVCGAHEFWMDGAGIWWAREGALEIAVGEMRDRILEAARWSIATQGPYASRCRDVKRRSYSTARIGAELSFTMQNSSGVYLEAVLSTFPSSNFPHARQNVESLVTDPSLLW
jgi:hypothetical protein